MCQLGLRLRHSRDLKVLWRTTFGWHCVGTKLFVSYIISQVGAKKLQLAMHLLLSVSVPSCPLIASFCQRAEQKETSEEARQKIYYTNTYIHLCYMCVYAKTSLQMSVNMSQHYKYFNELNRS